ncbi:palmitoyltransferase ZDHHC16A isoform X3 [Ictalurus furcatus]|uniref:palmitoyltransferase ZDHHC16A isoform X3 n=1 Tax=Ictalurus furcatus TaxID=66913 RepID=UPI0023508585|nr:palmitoyltransferase ZDHHC16A isoform X3 [Ictalurus furcatus]
MRLCSCAMHLLVRWMRSCMRRSRCRLPRRLQEHLSYTRLIFNSVCHNSLLNCDLVTDSLFEPVFWMVDIITRWFGMVFVFLVIVLTSSVLLVAYFCLLPLALKTYSLGWLVWHLSYGHWNLVMIVFHYYKATTTSPGYPPKMKTDIAFVSVCKKCIRPKPARTHHCGICKTCILKMDHHCPWLNNCVGHFNHRYFFSFCLCMTLGCIYCSISGRNLFIDAYHALDSQTSAPLTFKDRMFHKSVIYMWVLTSTVAVALGALTLWHAVLISRGETSIERHINNKEARRMAKRGKVYRNPFNYGTLNNWKVFFGVEKRSHWLTRVLLPSGHSPYGDGLTWDIYPIKKDMMPV